MTDFENFAGYLIGLIRAHRHVRMPVRWWRTGSGDEGAPQVGVKKGGMTGMRRTGWTAVVIAGTLLMAVCLSGPPVGATTGTEGTASVSYTHLDVYKRQRPMCS